MGLLKTIRQHAAMASGNFASILKDIEIPPLPAVIAELLTEVNRAEPDVAHLERIIQAEPEIAIRVLKTVNSPLFALPAPVASIRHAVALLGLERIRSLVLPYAALAAVPKPQGELFRHQAYWTDALHRALLARSLAKRCKLSTEEDAFTPMLLADVALPILFCQWREYYEPVLAEWSAGSERLSELERRHFGWDHAQAAAWILQYWDFPESLVCFAGVHNLSPQDIRRLELQNSAAMVLSVASHLPSALMPDVDRCRRLLQEADEHLLVAPPDWPEVIAEVRSCFAGVCEQFRIRAEATYIPLDQLEVLACTEECRS